jgi:hypothetical protein
MSCSRRADHNGRFFRRKKRCFRVSPFRRNLIGCIGGFAWRAKPWRAKPLRFAGSTGWGIPGTPASFVIKTHDKSWAIRADMASNGVTTKASLPWPG